MDDKRIRMIIKKILNKEIKSSDLTEIKLPNSKSKIIKNNKGILFCSIYKGLKGLFDKEIKETNEFGRKICGKVKSELSNHGFFTSDELPAYGITEGELAYIIKQTKADKDDLIAFFVYGKAEAEKTKEFLDGLLNSFKAKSF